MGFNQHVDLLSDHNFGPTKCERRHEAGLAAGIAAIGCAVQWQRRTELMRHLTQFSKLQAAFALLILAIACSPIYTNHGFIPPDDELESLEVGVANREEVLEITGTPMTTNDTYGEAWYFVSSRFRQDGYKEAKEVERQVLAISFDETGTVSNIEKFALRDGRTVAISRRVTETNVGRLTFVDQIMRGLGRIDPTRALAR